ncbi:MAG: hypothetical protein VW625_08170 [Perlucidibaca sp.]
MLAAAGVPAGSLRGAGALRDELQQSGLTLTACESLDHEVLDGFADFVARRRQALSWSARLTPGWAKISLTARLCRWMRTQGLVGYSLLSATRTTPASTQTP